MTVRIGIIGCGKITERASLPNIVNYSKAKVAALCDIEMDRARGAKKTFKLEDAEVLSDWRKMVTRKDIDAIFVNTPNYLHEEMAVGALENGKHVLVEKPLTISVAAADNMVKAAKKGAFLMVEQTQRFDPIHQAAKKFIDSGQLGKINMSERQRREALHNAFIGVLFADAVAWVCSKARRQSAGVFVTPSPKY